MNRFRRWLERLFGLQSEVERQVELTVRANTALAGAVARTEAVLDAEAYAAELAPTHPQLAAAIRAAIAEQVAGLTVAPAVLPAAETVVPVPPSPLALPTKRPPGRPRKPAPLTAPETPPPTTTGDR